MQSNISVRKDSSSHQFNFLTMSDGKSYSISIICLNLSPREYTRIVSFTDTNPYTYYSHFEYYLPLCKCGHVYLANEQKETLETVTSMGGPDAVFHYLKQIGYDRYLTV